MPTVDEEQFERYLKQFRPLATGVLPPNTPERVSWRPSIFAVCAGAGASVIIAAAIALHFQAPTASRSSANHVIVVEKAVAWEPEPLTVRSANALLTEFSSVKAALDEAAFHSQPTQIRKGERSVIEVLSKEKTRL